MTRWKATLAVLVATVSLSVATIASAAATIALSANVANTFDATGVLIGAGALYSANSGQNRIYQVDILETITGASATQSFGAASEDAILGAGLSRSTVNNASVRINWFPNNPAMTNVADSSGNPIPNIFSNGDNADLGTSNADLVGLVQDVDGATLGKTVDPNTFLPVADPRQAIGKGSAFKLGSVFVVFNNGAPGSTATLSFANTAAAIADSSATPVFGPSTPMTIAPVVFTVPTPEPTSIALMGLGALGLIGMKLRRRSA
jgi:PEP-CTERM motif